MYIGLYVSEGKKGLNERNSLRSPFTHRQKVVRLFISASHPKGPAPASSGGGGSTVPQQTSPNKLSFPAGLSLNKHAPGWKSRPRGALETPLFACAFVCTRICRAATGENHFRARRARALFTVLGLKKEWPISWAFVLGLLKCYYYNGPPARTIHYAHLAKHGTRRSGPTKISKERIITLPRESPAAFSYTLLRVYPGKAS